MNLYDRLRKVDSSLPDVFLSLKERLWFSYLRSALNNEEKNGGWTGIEKGIMFLIPKTLYPKSSSGENIVISILSYLKNKAEELMEDYYALRAVEIVEDVLIHFGHKNTKFVKDLKNFGFFCSKCIGNLSKASRYLSSKNGKLYTNLISSFRKSEVVVGSIFSKGGRPFSMSVAVFKGRVFLKSVKVLAQPVKAKIYISKLFRMAVPFVSFSARKTTRRKWFKELAGSDSFLDLGELLREIPEFKNDPQLRRIKKSISFYRKSGDVFKLSYMNMGAYLRVLDIMENMRPFQFYGMDVEKVGDFYPDFVKENTL